MIYEFIDFTMGRTLSHSKYVMVRGKQQGNLQSDHSSFFCSQFVAEALPSCGVLQDSHEGLSSTNYSPADFSNEGFLPLLAPFIYFDEIIINQLGPVKERKATKIPE